MTDCVPWAGYVAPSGYGQIGRNRYAHRVAYEDQHGPIPPGHEIHHTCGMRHCVNPDHLKLVTRSEHWQAEQQLKGDDFRWRNRARPTHCPHGHDLSVHGKFFPSRPTRRVCGACVTARNRARYVPKCVAWQGTDGP